MDAITLLTQDHDTVESVFAKYEQTTERAHKTRRKLVDQMIKELSIHATIEEDVFYPAVRQGVEEVEDDVLEGIAEHHIVKWTLSELQRAEPTDEMFHPRVTILMEMVRHHVEEEEGEMFPSVKQAMSNDELADLGERLAVAKVTAPSTPRPKPATPTA